MFLFVDKIKSLVHVNMNFLIFRNLFWYFVTSNRRREEKGVGGGGVFRAKLHIKGQVGVKGKIMKKFKNINK